MAKRRKLDQSGHLRSRLSDETNPRLIGVLEHNIKIIEHMRAQAEARRSAQDRFADATTRFSGSMLFLYLHAVWFALWVVVNTGILPGIKPFDPFPFGFLTMVVSLEAIFLSTIVLISQNRQRALHEKHETPDLQIDLLAEYEITRMLGLVDKIAQKLGIDDGDHAEIMELCEPVVPDVVMREIERQESKLQSAS